MFPGALTLTLVYFLRHRARFPFCIKIPLFSTPLSVSRAPLDSPRAVLHPYLRSRDSVTGISGPSSTRPFPEPLIANPHIPYHPASNHPNRGPKRKNKCFKTEVDDVFLRLEEDIRLGEAMDFADRVLVGRIRGRSYTAARLKTWATAVWGHHLADIPFVQTFVRGWFALRFARADHTNWVLSSFWHFDHAPVLLKRWTPLFDPETEQIGIGPTWI